MSEKEKEIMESICRKLPKLTHNALEQYAARMDGVIEGRESGYADGYKDGRASGYEEGFAAGKAHAEKSEQITGG